MGFATDDPLGYVISNNLRHRHLNESQRAMVAAKIANLEKGEVGKGHEKTDAQICRAEAATQFNVSERSVNTAKKVEKECISEIINAVEAGEITVSDAVKAAELPKEKQQAVIEVATSKTKKTIGAAIRQVESWFKRWPNAQIALVTGLVSGEDDF